MLLKHDICEILSMEDICIFIEFISLFSFIISNWIRKLTKWYGLLLFCVGCQVERLFMYQTCNSNLTVLCSV